MNFFKDKELFVKEKKKTWVVHFLCAVQYVHTVLMR